MVRESQQQQFLARAIMIRQIQRLSTLIIAEVIEELRERTGSRDVQIEVPQRRIFLLTVI